MKQDSEGAAVVPAMCGGGSGEQRCGGGCVRLPKGIELSTKER
jgi:hypothetical protein